MNHLGLLFQGIPQQPLATAAFWLSSASAAIHGGYLCLTHKLPIYEGEACIHFSIYRSHWAVTSTAMTLAGFGFVCLVLALFATPRAALCWRNIITALLLAPAAYTGTCIVRLFI